MRFHLWEDAAESLNAVKGHTVELISKFSDMHTKITIYQVENENRSKVRYKHWCKTSDSFLFLG